MTRHDALTHAIHRVAGGHALGFDETRDAFDILMRGDATPVLTTALLFGLRARGETPAEVAGAAAALRSAMVRIHPRDAARLVDTCGTGGGVVTTLNVSTAAAFVAAGAGVPVAKHGNRSYTSRSGSADVLEALGIDISLPPERAADVLEHCGLTFLFAPTYHPAMRHAGPTRRELAVPTIMNLLGPLVNPAGARRQVIGVADRARAPVVAEALLQLDAIRAIVVHAAVGMDEISPSGPTFAWEVCDGRVKEWALNPAEFGLENDDLPSLAGGEPAENAARIEALFDGRGRAAERAAVILNSAAAIYVGDGGGTFAHAVGRAMRALDGGAARAVLDRLRLAAPKAR